MLPGLGYLGLPYPCRQSTLSDADPDKGYGSDHSGVVGHCHPNTIGIREREEAVSVANIGSWEAELRPVGVSKIGEEGGREESDGARRGAGWVTPCICSVPQSRVSVCCSFLVSAALVAFLKTF